MGACKVCWSDASGELCANCRTSIIRWKCIIDLKKKKENLKIGETIYLGSGIHHSVWLVKLSNDRHGLLLLDHLPADDEDVCVCDANPQIIDPTDQSLGRLAAMVLYHTNAYDSSDCIDL